MQKSIKIVIIISVIIIFGTLFGSTYVVFNYRSDYQKQPIDSSDLDVIEYWMKQDNKMNDMISECYKENEWKYINNECYLKMIRYKREITKNQEQMKSIEQNNMIIKRLGE